MKKLYFLLCILALTLCAALPALAEEARSLTEECEIRSTDYRNNFRLSDGKTKMRYDKDAAKKSGGRWIELTLPAGETAQGLYMIWPSDTPPVALDVWDEGAKDFVYCCDVNKGQFVHEYVPVPDATRLRFRSTDEKGSLPLCELSVMSQGDLPDWVQVWQPTPEKADLLVFIAHPDDEYLFLGGTIPTYAGERGLHVAVCYMTVKEEPRLHELLNGLWTAGCREYPELLMMYDKLCYDSPRLAYKYWDGIDNAMDVVAAMLDRLRPEVVVTHDLKGEYGHGAHMAVAELCLKIIRDGERPLAYPPKKLYLHLWEENQLMMDWETPLSHFGGQTAIEVATAAYKCHVSQQGFSHKFRSGKVFRFEVKSHGMYDNAKFGLAYTSVGLDVAMNDFMENIPAK